MKTMKYISVVLLLLLAISCTQESEFELVKTIAIDQTPDPIDPVDPIDPIDPVDPVDPLLVTWLDADNSSTALTLSTTCTDCSIATVTNPDAADSGATNVTQWTIDSTSGSGNKSLFLISTMEKLFHLPIILI